MAGRTDIATRAAVAGRSCGGVGSRVESAMVGGTARTVVCRGCRIGRGGVAIALAADVRAAAAAAARSLRFFHRAIAPLTATIAMKMIVSVFTWEARRGA